MSKSARAKFTFYAHTPDGSSRLFEEGAKVPAEVARLYPDAVDGAPDVDASVEVLEVTRAEYDEHREQTVRDFVRAFSLVEDEAVLNSYADAYFRGISQDDTPGPEDHDHGPQEPDDSAAEGDGDQDDQGADDGPQEPFDPDAYTATEVYDHLDALDLDTEAGRQEWDRVVALEQARPRPRVTAIPARD